MPFFQGGMLGMADEALDGRTSIGTLVSSGKANYLNLLLAYLAIFAINFAFGIVVMFATFFGWVGLFANGGEPSLAVLGVLVVIGLLFLLAYLLVIFTIQFYAHAIVLSDTDLVAGFKRSLSLVRRNLLSVFGYSLLLLAGSLVLGGIGTAASFFLSPQSQQTMVSVPDLSLPLIAGAAVVYVLVLALLGAFYVTYSVAFYRAIEKSRSAI